jgi:hypothetical protein
MPKGNKIRKVTCNYAARTGEGIKLEIYNEDGATSEASYTTSDGAEHTGSLATSAPLTGGDSERITLRFTLTSTNTYDENDRGQMHIVVVYGQYESTHPDYAAPGYTNGEIALDALILGGSEISADYGGIVDPGLALSAFTSMGDDYEPIDRIIARALAFGDSSQNTYGLCIWDETGASDGKPKAALTARSVADYEYIASLEELEQFSDEPTLDELWNWIIIKYTDSEGLTQYLTGDDDATLTDASSVAAYGERHSQVIDIGKGDDTIAQDIGQRTLAYHKDPLYKTGFTLRGQVRSKAGVWLPANQVRAGQRIKILDYKSGITYFIRHTSYGADGGTLRIEPDLPPDSMAVFMAQREMG